MPRRHTTADHRRSAALPDAGAGLGPARRRPESQRTYRFKNFREALGFVQRAGELAEAEGHHPDIAFGWGYATVSLQTRNSRACMRTTSSWLPSSTACRQPSAHPHSGGTRTCYGLFSNLAGRQSWSHPTSRDLQAGPSEVAPKLGFAGRALIRELAMRRALATAAGLALLALVPPPGPRRPRTPSAPPTRDSRRRSTGVTARLRGVLYAGRGRPPARRAARGRPRGDRAGVAGGDPERPAGPVAPAGRDRGPRRHRLRDRQRDFHDAERQRLAHATREP